MLFLLFAIPYFNFSMFNGGKNEALSFLGTSVQALSTIIAILFTVILFMGEFTVGKYIAKTIDYIIFNSNSITILLFYLTSIGVCLFSILLISLEEWKVYTDISIILTAICLMILIPYFLYISKLLKPTHILDQIAYEINLKDTNSPNINTKQLQSLFSITGKLAKNNEIIDARYGLDLIANIMITDLQKEGNVNIFYYQWIFGQLERFGIEFFDEDPSITESVISQFSKIFAEFDETFFITNFGYWIANALVQISSRVFDRLYAKNSVLQSYELLLHIYVTQAVADSFVFRGTLLHQIQQTIRLLRAIDVQNYVIAGFSVRYQIEKLIDSDKDDSAIALIHTIFNTIPNNDEALLSIFNIMMGIPVEREETMKQVIDKIKQRFGDFAGGYQTLYHRR